MTCFSVLSLQLNQQVASVNLSKNGVMQRLLKGFLKKCIFNRVIAIFIGSSIILLSGCASNGHSDFYKKNLNNEDLSKLILSKSGQTPELIRTSDMDADFRKLKSKHFEVIGVSEFNGKPHGEKELTDQAIKVGATHVLFYAKFVTAQQLSQPLILPNGIGGFNTTTLSSQQMRYDQKAYFLAKRKEAPLVGIYPIDLTIEKKKEIGRNSGIMVWVVYEETPAFYANILPDDIIIEVNGKQILNEDDFSIFIKSIDIKRDGVVFKIIRGGEKMEFVVVEKS